MPAPNQTDVMLGEVRGQMRELIHGLNNLTAKVDGLAMQVASGSAVPGDVKTNATKIAELTVRVDALERINDRREGATGALQWLLKWGTPLFSMLTAVYLGLRALGVIHIPADEPKTVIPQAQVTVKGEAISAPPAAGVP